LKHLCLLCFLGSKR